MSKSTKIAAIDIGSYTSRLLIADASAGEVFRPLKRSRVYTRLAEGFEGRGEVLSSAAMERTVQALSEFQCLAREHSVADLRTVCTGVVRRAKNQDAFLERIKKATGLNAEVISGQREAILTAKGVLNGITVENPSYLIFDLGGGTTEFVFGHRTRTEIKSLDLGTAVLNERFLLSDPADDKEIQALRGAVERILKQAFAKQEHRTQYPAVIGTGGTVTTLAAMLGRIPAEEIGPEKINGRVLAIQELKELCSGLKGLVSSERQKRVGLDASRAEIIVAGLLIVIGILEFFEARQLQVSFSDLLEGMILEYLSI